MEQSKSGYPIYRHKEADQKPFEFAAGGDHIEDISNHIEKHIGKVHMVYHEIISDQVHIDIHWVKPSDSRPYHTLVTSGMSDKPMNSPEGVEDYDFAELCICLPEDWKLSEEDFKEESNYWPIRWLKVLARLPHQYNTWLSHGHTVPNGDPAQPFAENTQLNTILLFSSVFRDADFHTLKLPEKTIRFFSLVPLYEEEVTVKLDQGVEALYDGFEEYGVDDVLYLNRVNVVTRRKPGAPIPPPQAYKNTSPEGIKVKKWWEFWK